MRLVNRLLWFALGGLATLTAQLLLGSIYRLETFPQTDIALTRYRHVEPPLRNTPAKTTATNTLRPTQAPTKAPAKERRFHYVFSTGCSTYQDWQSYAFFYHMLLLNTTADVTRVASGCNEHDAVKLQDVFAKEIRSMSDRFHLFQTPDFSFAHKGKPDNTQYYFFNKPMGLRYWFDHGLQFTAHRDELEEVIFIILDPDELVLRPFTDDYTNEDIVWHPREGFSPRIEHGKPMAQIYDLGTQFVDQINMDVILKSNTTPSAVRHWTHADVMKHYHAGPPYLATGRDMYAIVSTWADFCVEVYRQTRHHLSEMFAYSVAAAHLNLPHQLVSSFMVGNVVVDSDEGWGSIDAMPISQICQRPRTSAYVIHYCQRYMLGDFVFTKSSLPQDFLTCDHPLMEVPNASFPELGYTQATPPNGQVYDILPGRRRRQAFLLCEMLSRLNEVATYWKQHHCHGHANYQAIGRFPVYNKTIHRWDLYHGGQY